jgi:hypothetical protein
VNSSVSQERGTCFSRFPLAKFVLSCFAEAYNPSHVAEQVGHIQRYGHIAKKVGLDGHRAGGRFEDHNER